MTKPRLLSLAASAALWFSTSSCAVADPADTASAYYNALLQGEYSKAALMIAPAEISKLRGRMNFLYVTEDKNLNNFWSMYGPEATPETVGNLPDEEFFDVIFVKVHSFSMNDDQFRFTSFEVLGTVMEGEKYAHVLLRFSFPDETESDFSPDQLSMYLTEEGWRVEMDSGVDGFVSALEGQHDFTK